MILRITLLIFPMFLFIIPLRIWEKKKVTRTGMLGAALFSFVFFIIVISHFLGFVLFYDTLEQTAIINTESAKQIIQVQFIDGFLKKITSETINGSYSDFTGFFFFLLGIIGLVFAFAQKKKATPHLFLFTAGFCSTILFFTSIMIFFNTTELYFYRILRPFFIGFL